MGLWLGAIAGGLEGASRGLDSMSQAQRLRQEQLRQAILDAVSIDNTRQDNARGDRDLRLRELDAGWVDGSPPTATVTGALSPEDVANLANTKLGDFKPGTFANALPHVDVNPNGTAGYFDPMQSKTMRDYRARQQLVAAADKEKRDLIVSSALTLKKPNGTAYTPEEAAAIALGGQPALRGAVFPHNIDRLSPEGLQATAQLSQIPRRPYTPSSHPRQPNPISQAASREHLFSLQATRAVTAANGDVRKAEEILRNDPTTAPEFGLGMNASYLNAAAAAYRAKFPTQTSQAQNRSPGALTNLIVDAAKGAPSRRQAQPSEQQRDWDAAAAALRAKGDPHPAATLGPRPPR